jgi:hypothetical protein
MATFSEEQVHITAQGVSDTNLMLDFTVKSKDGWTCPGVNISRKPNGRIDVWFCRAKTQNASSTQCDIPVTPDADKPGVFTVEIPHDWNDHNEVEIFIDGTRSLGKWTLKKDQDDNP